jgi:hypothetical protein
VKGGRKEEESKRKTWAVESFNLNNRINRKKKRTFCCCWKGRKTSSLRHATRERRMREDKERRNDSCLDNASLGLESNMRS